MTTKIVIHLDASHDLAYINSQVDQNEQTMGTLSAIGNDGSTTTLTFSAIGLIRPAAVIAAQVAGVPSIPTGAKLVAKGSIFISGQLVLSAATRASAAPAAAP